MGLSLSASPYIIGPPVTGSNFYGRRRQIDQFCRMLRSQVLQPVRVLGLRRSGKTSFLQHVMDDKVSGSAPKSDSHLTVIAYVDLQAGVEIRSDFYLAVADAIARRIPFRQKLKVPESFSSFRAFSMWLDLVFDLSERLRLVVLLDELEVLESYPAFGLSSFLSFLRSLVNSRFAWITASYSDLHALPRHERELASPFFNVFHTTPIVLGPLEPGESEMLIREPAQKNGVEFSLQEVEVIQDIAGPMPYLLQVTAHQWFFTRRSTKSVDQCRKRVLEQLRGSSRMQHQLEHYWRHLSNQERDCLRMVVLGESHSAIGMDVPQKLLNFGLLQQGSNGLKAAGRVLSDWIKSNCLERSPDMATSEIAPFVPIIVEATKFVFNEASRWIEGIRKKTPGKVPDSELTLSITKTELLKAQADLKGMAAMMDCAVAKTKAYEIQELIKQIQTHHRNLIDWESQETELGVMVLPHVMRGIERETEGIVKKTVRLIKLLNQVFLKTV